MTSQKSQNSNMLLAFLTLLGVIVPVSYTHLDVYKRQA